MKGGGSMATYIMLVSFTQKGIENIKESAARLDANKKAFQAMGAELKESYSTMGRYDICLLYTSPSPRDRQKSRMPSSA